VCPLAEAWIVTVAGYPYMDDEGRPWAVQAKSDALDLAQAIARTGIDKDCAVARASTPLTPHADVHREVRRVENWAKAAVGFANERDDVGEHAFDFTRDRPIFGWKDATTYSRDASRRAQDRLGVNFAQNPVSRLIFDHAYVQHVLARWQAWADSR